MTQYLRTKLNSMLRKWPHNTVATSNWLQKQGVNPDLVFHYEKSKWLEKVGYGAFIKSGDKIAWEGGVYAIQNLLKLPIHVGGRTALSLKGFAHYLRFGGETVKLFARTKVKLPAWFKNYNWKVKVKYSTAQLFATECKEGLLNYDVGEFAIKISAPERAMLELLDMVPTSETFEEASQIMDGLTIVRSDIVQKLLQDCTSIKVKRLFLYLAEKSQHKWFKDIKLKKINIGSGKRVIVKGGKLIPKYKIVVPVSNEENFI
jgi:hypothetical protein